MQKIKFIFQIAALYDLLLAIAFLIMPHGIFSYFEVTPPNHIAYVQFPALLLIIFAYIFYQIAKDPLGKREDIIYGTMLKISYVGVVGYYFLTSDIPNMWLPWAICDFIFLLLFVYSYQVLNSDSTK